MKLTEKTVTKEVETSETVCEISRDEFSTLCAKLASALVIETVGEEPDFDDVMAGIAMTAVLAKFAARVELKLFDTDTTENPDKKEEK